MAKEDIIGERGAVRHYNEFRKKRIESRAKIRSIPNPL